MRRAGVCAPTRAQCLAAPRTRPARGNDCAPCAHDAEPPRKRRAIAAALSAGGFVGSHRKGMLIKSAHVQARSGVHAGCSSPRNRCRARAEGESPAERLQRVRRRTLLRAPRGAPAAPRGPTAAGRLGRAHRPGQDQKDEGEQRGGRRARLAHISSERAARALGYVGGGMYARSNSSKVAVVRAFVPNRLI